MDSSLSASKGIFPLSGSLDTPVSFYGLKAPEAVSWYVDSGLFPKQLHCFSDEGSPQVLRRAEAGLSPPAAFLPLKSQASIFKFQSLSQLLTYLFHVCGFPYEAIAVWV